MRWNRTYRILAISTLVLLAVSALGAIGFVHAVYRNPPLRFGGAMGGFRGEMDQKIVVGFELVNEGRFDAHIQEVIIEEYPGQQATVIGVSGVIGTGAMIGGTIPPDPLELGYFLVPLNDFVIPPRKNLQPSVRDGNTGYFRKPQYYGLAVRYRFVESGLSPMGRVTVKYTYMGLPLTLQDEFRVRSSAE